MNLSMVASHIWDDCRRAVSLGPGRVLAGAGRRFYRRTSAWWRRRHDVAAPVRADRPVRRLTGRYLPPLVWRTPTLELLTQHRFDLLGSGWTQLRYGMRCRGLLGHRFEMSPQVGGFDTEGNWLSSFLLPTHLDDARRVWQLVKLPYEPIDWQLDFKSGYRWDARCWHGDIRVMPAIGADIKVPWELARCQHLPQLALAFEGTKDDNCVREFQNQILDFIATNPPRMGVNWRCPMDVAIRAVNWLVAYDLFCAKGVVFAPDVEQELARSVYEHGLHVVEHLEWSPARRGNHYLSNLVGLLFIAAYLESGAQTDAWLAFSIGQLVAEVERQFTEDGAHFEASTGYHRLAAEMVAWATALTLAIPPGRLKAAITNGVADFPLPRGLHHNLPQLYPVPFGDRGSPFSAEYFRRLAGMVTFSRHITKPNGRPHLIGDHDSGQFLKLAPEFTRRSVQQARAMYANLDNYNELPAEADYWDENQVSHLPVVAAIRGIVDDNVETVGGGPERNVTSLTRHLSGRTANLTNSFCRPPKLSSDFSRITRCSRNDQTLAAVVAALFAEGASIAQSIPIELPAEIVRDSLQWFCYEDFGLYIWRTPRLYLAVRCGGRGQEIGGAHAHNDQLAVELNVDGHDSIGDPGTHLYTPDPAMRNAYRSAKAHFVPRPEDLREPARLDLGLFRRGPHRVAECLYAGFDGFAGRYDAFGPAVYRIVRLTSAGIEICDLANPPLRLVPLLPVGMEHPWTSSVLPTSGYGIVCNSHE